MTTSISHIDTLQGLPLSRPSRPRGYLSTIQIRACKGGDGGRAWQWRLWRTYDPRSLGEPESLSRCLAQSLCQYISDYMQHRLVHRPVVASEGQPSHMSHPGWAGVLETRFCYQESTAGEGSNQGVDAARQVQRGHWLCGRRGTGLTGDDHRGSYWLNVGVPQPVSPICRLY